MAYASWRIGFQDSEHAAKSAYMQVHDLYIENESLRQQLAEIQSTWLSPDTYEALMAERQETLKELAEARKDAERYRWLRDNSLSIKWIPSRYNENIVSGFSAFNTGYLGVNFEEAIDEAMKETSHDCPRTSD